MINTYSVYINSMSNNTIITLVKNNCFIIYGSSSGKLGYKGTKKSTAYAAQLVAETVKSFIKNIGIKFIKLFIKGFGYGRESAIRTFSSSKFIVISLTDITPIVFNGCRSKKIRRV